MSEGVIIALATVAGLLAREAFGWVKGRRDGQVTRLLKSGAINTSDADRLWAQLTQELERVRVERAEFASKFYEQMTRSIDLDRKLAATQGQLQQVSNDLDRERLARLDLEQEIATLRRQVNGGDRA